MVNKSGRIGSEWEIRLLNGLRDEGFDVERLRLSGKEDEGDLRVLDGHHIVIEAKAEKAINLPAYLREIAVEKSNYQKRRKLDPGAVDGVVIVKARGQNWKDGYVVQSVREFFKLNKEGDDA